ncbi:endonuclease/exonuclease/phosphatase family protein [Psychrobacillus vulpis]|nr:endonuclease/exonuclease/phosphatase family protein [Psychrobacillus vulpis]
MSNTMLSLRRLAEHIGHMPQDFLSLRKLLGHPSGPLKLSVRFAPFSIMTYNMALLVEPFYKGTDREGAIAEIVARIKALAPDVVGLCEVFDDSERTKIRNELRDLYPYFQEGPDEPDWDEDGGLLLLSKHSILAADYTVFQDSDGFDYFANKGMIFIRIQPVSWPDTLNIFFSHTQDISTNDGVNTLYSQLNAMNNFIAWPWRGQQHIIMGDLNIPGENPQHYAQLLSRLGAPRDCWTLAGNQAASGHTFVIDNNFYEDSEDRPSNNQRLDYVLMKAGTHLVPMHIMTAGTYLVPMLEDIKVLKFQRNGRFISDHFGVHASFDKIALINYN